MVSAAKPRRASGRRYTKRDRQAYLYIAPWIIGFLLLQLYPFVESLIYSFCN